ncbi:hypothetical protein M2103_001826 [Ereboglobus sp. PH5-5]|uniref:PD-(D/E)XK nuclease family protein n=1 Tax=Ereboglobus sp. PH5-5 TaxID=2940529 RepID=UPI00240706D3|nr:PD-(D/E)XK nuclease family protein [Ereboglobus sp. PH5-5]MDF9833599.1 hypothetical protein [Ereboglobus sp. PH5-5]
MDHTVKMLKEKLDNFCPEIPSSLLYLLFQKVNAISRDEKGRRREETLHSEMLAALLNPESNGDLGTVLIETLLDELPRKVAWSSEAGHGNKFIIELERRVACEGANERPIDILISWEGAEGGKHAIIIENKLAGAVDQENQLNDYYDGLKREHFAVHGIIYIPFKGEKKPSYLKKNVHEKTVVMDAKKITTKWLGNAITRARHRGKSAKTIAAIEYYKDFLESFIINKAKLMKSCDILSEMTSTQVRSLEALLASDEWIEAKFTNITKILKQRLGPDLKMQPQRYKDLHTDGGPRHNVRYYFDTSDYWIEVWMDAKKLVFYICSTEEKDWVTIGGMKYYFDSKDNGGNRRGGRGNYYYYANEKGHEFDYPSKASEVNAELIEAVALILGHLSPQNAPRREAEKGQDKVC